MHFNDFIFFFRYFANLILEWKDLIRWICQITLTSTLIIESSTSSISVLAFQIS